MSENQPGPIPSNSTPGSGGTPDIDGEMQTRIANAPFQLSQEPVTDEAASGSQAFVHTFAAPAYEHLGELPSSYGTQSVYLVAYDPHQLFAYWDLAPIGGFERKYALHVCHPNGVVMHQVDIHPSEAGRYISAGQPGGTYYVELGTYERNGSWQVIATSGRVTLPAEGLAGETEPKFATLPFHLSFQRLMELIETAMGSKEDLTAALAKLQRGERPAVSSLLGALSHLSADQLHTLELLLGQKFAVDSESNSSRLSSESNVFRDRRDAITSPGHSSEAFSAATAGGSETLSSATGAFGSETLSSGALAAGGNETLSSSAMSSGAMLKPLSSESVSSFSGQMGSETLSSFAGTMGSETVSSFTSALSSESVSSLMGQPSSETLSSLTGGIGGESLSSFSGLSSESMSAFSQGLSSENLSSLTQGLSSESLSSSGQGLSSESLPSLTSGLGSESLSSFGQGFSSESFSSFIAGLSSESLTSGGFSSGTLLSLLAGMSSESLTSFFGALAGSSEFLSSGILAAGPSSEAWRMASSGQSLSSGDLLSSEQAAFFIKAVESNLEVLSPLFSHGFSSLESLSSFAGSGASGSNLNSEGIATKKSLW